MRKVVIYSLIAFYFLISIRLTGNFHYCCGQLRSVSLVGFSHAPDCCTPKISKKPCCENVKLTFQKISKDKPHAQPTAPQYLAVQLLLPGRFSEQNAKIPVQKKIVPSSNAPPPEAFPPLFIQHCTYRI